MKWYLLMVVFNLHGTIRSGILPFDSRLECRQADKFMYDVEDAIRTNPREIGMLLGVKPKDFVKDPHHIAMCVPFVELGGGLK